MPERRHTGPRRCPSTRCAEDLLAVERDRAQRKLWHITCRQGRRWAVAADVPVCPSCGTTLQPAAATGLLTGPVFDFIRELAG